jgi:predicted HAD superfamily hydrolase
MSLSELAALAASPNVHLVSTDIFDTVLLRDYSTETGRLAIACRRSASSLGLDARSLTRLRWWLQVDSYRAVAVGRPSGEARLTAIYDVIAMVLDLHPGAAQVMYQIEVETDIEHLKPNRELLQLLEDIAKAGTRVVAVSDTYYSSRSLDRMLDAVVGPHPIKTIYSSADLGLTKHVGLVFDAVATAEGVAPNSIVHVGDHYEVDVLNAQKAAWAAVHLAPIGRARLRRSARRARDTMTLIRRMQ